MNQYGTVGGENCQKNVSIRGRGENVFSDMKGADGMVHR